MVPAGSDENAVYMRSLRPGEEDTGEAVHVPAGKRLVIRLTYAGEGIVFTTGLPVALGHCRKVLLSVIDLRPQCEISRPKSPNG